MVEWSDLCAQLHPCPFLSGNTSGPTQKRRSRDFQHVVFLGGSQRGTRRIREPSRLPPPARIHGASPSRQPACKCPIREALSFPERRFCAAQQPSLDGKVRPRLGVFGNDSGDGIAVIPLCQENFFMQKFPAGRDAAPGFPEAAIRRATFSNGDFMSRGLDGGRCVSRTPAGTNRCA
jgi:hypothetical protein